MNEMQSVVAGAPSSGSFEPKIIRKPTSNGVDCSVGSTGSVWGMVSRWLPPRNADCDYWWQLTGQHLATMLFEAGYSVHEQYEGMIFHYHWVVPRLGPSPLAGGIPTWKSLLTVDGSPFEYSWKWNSADGAPDVRYTVEPIGLFKGTILDPLNQASTRELLYQLGLIMPSLDLSWFHHFASVFYDAEKEKYMTEANAHSTSTIALAFEFLKEGLVVKAYLSPKKVGQKGPAELDIWTNAIRDVLPSSATLDKVVHFLKTNPQGLSLQPLVLSIDCVKPSKSRMKLYFQTPHTNFDSVRTIMTLGGQIQGVEAALEELQELIKLVAGLDKDFPSSQELPTRASTAIDHFTDMPVLASGYLYYFDFAARSSMPDIKFYIPTRQYGENDLKVARGLIDFMESRGRGQYAKNYMRVLDRLATHRPLESAAGIQTYVSCAFQNGLLSITTYLASEAYRLNKQAK